MSPLSPLRLPVKTESGQVLGQVVDITIDPDTQAIISYTVKSSRLMPNIVQSPLIIHRSQVISIDDKQLVVEDGTMKAAAPNAQPEASA